MLGLTLTTKIFVYNKPCDMRKGFDSLAGLVLSEIKMQPTSGYLFVFFNRVRTHVKILFWDTDGYCIYYKRLERGTYNYTSKNDCENQQLTSDELYLILRGIDIEKTKKRKRYLSKNIVDY